jgi:hypothetical protein
MLWAYDVYRSALRTRAIFRWRLSSLKIKQRHQYLWHFVAESDVPRGCWRNWEFHSRQAVYNQQFTNV